jgi:antitoxin (DNA-binding transcriptional repressor) of toxin-antitoxin stability system
MKTATVTLKQLRTDPREYVRLLNNGYEISITEHRKPLARAVQPAASKVKRGNVADVLKTMRELPPIETPYPEMDTVELIKQTRIKGYEAKLRELENGDKVDRT